VFVAVDKLIGAKVVYDNGPVLHLMFRDEKPRDIRLTPAQLQGLAYDAVTVLLAYHKVEVRG
jgi:hypothetical protein